MNRSDPVLEKLLDQEAVLCHPFVIGEIACSQMRNRDVILTGLHDLDMVACVSDQEALLLVERSRLCGRGIGFIDIHLLASSLVSGVPLWTRDRALHAIAEELEAAF